MAYFKVSFSTKCKGQIQPNESRLQLGRGFMFMFVFKDRVVVVFFFESDDFRRNVSGYKKHELQPPS